MATVRVSAGFRPNKMLLSMREGVRGVCVCVCVCVCVHVCVCVDSEEEAER